MKWKDCTGTYTAYISLGSTCQTAYHLKRLHLRSFAGPLDWFMSDSVTDVSNLIRNHFQGLMEFNHLQVLGMYPGYYIVRDNSYDIVSYHDFPLIYRWTDSYPDFKQKIDRRVRALLKVARKGPLCFVRNQTTKIEAMQLYAALRTIVPGTFRLLIVNNLDIFEVRHEDWGLPNIASVSVPKGADWKGSHLAWDLIMKDFKLNYNLSGNIS